MKVNTDKVGVTQRPMQGVRSSGSGNILGDPFSDFSKITNRTARIYMPQKKHVHNHPQDKTIGKYWVIDFPITSTYKSPLMQWTSGSLDAHSSKGENNNFQIKFPSVNAAVNYCKMMGWGYDLQYPNFKYHTSKNYADNFKWKGNAASEPEYD